MDGGDLRPARRANWRPDNPARGQCGVTALVVQDLLGGDLILGEVLVGGARTGYHYWNRLPDGRDVDLTAEQFRPEEVIVGGRVQHRPPGAPRRCRRQYELLRQRVLTELGTGTDAGQRRS
ncbi:YunG family protein [Micromonospora sp. WMMA1923]|uniref:YunG family protein n=1 Tax=Micromonospora sp. WMMA1923 TaxID=3404125 RepID=UPI003B954508